MTVYAFHAVGTDLVKIGFTHYTGPDERLRDLQRKCPHRLALMGCAFMAPEWMFHDRFAPSKTIVDWYGSNRRSREWFSLGEDDRIRVMLMMCSVKVTIAWEDALLEHLRIRRPSLRRYMSGKRLDVWVAGLVASGEAAEALGNINNKIKKRVLAMISDEQFVAPPERDVA